MRAFTLLNEMDHLFNTVAAKNYSAESDQSFSPPCDVSEADDHYVMTFDLPGVRKEDLKIEASGALLTLSGEKRRQLPNIESYKSQRLERDFGTFKRSFTLPVSIDNSKIEAQYKDGVLQLSLPKVQTAQTRLIEIQSHS